MAFNRVPFLEVLEDSFTGYYDITKENLPEDLPVIYRADYYQRSERYWLTKGIPIWGNEMNELAYIFSADSFDQETVDRCIQFALDDGLPRVKPHKEHQCTNIKTLFVAPEFSKDVLKDIKKRKFQKSYNHSLWGFSSLLTGAVSLNTESVVTNKAGKGLQKYFKQLFAAQHKKESC